jgi:hypothetical protein
MAISGLSVGRRKGGGGLFGDPQVATRSINGNQVQNPNSNGIIAGRVLLKVSSSCESIS